VLLDRLLDATGLAVRPLAVCDVRHGARLELSPPVTAQMYCVLAGEGALHIADGPSLQLAPAAIAIVPAGISHEFVPPGGGTRLLSLRSLGTSDHVPTVVAGDGEPGLLFAVGRVLSANGTPSPFDRLAMPIAVDLSDASLAAQTFAMLLAEQGRSAPGKRHMTELLMTQCLIQLLRELPSIWAPSRVNAVGGV
jgi:hypothetical protein